jgi:hypothetical protein
VALAFAPRSVEDHVTTDDVGVAERDREAAEIIGSELDEANPPTS